MMRLIFAALVLAGLAACSEMTNENGLGFAEPVTKTVFV